MVPLLSYQHTEPTKNFWLAENSISMNLPKPDDFIGQFGSLKIIPSGFRIKLENNEKTLDALFAGIRKDNKER
jgi:hypothetical protein